MSIPLELVNRYMASFFGEAPLKSMESLLAEDLIFEGPFHKSSTAREYLDALSENPPETVRYELEEIYEKENFICLIYMFSKPGVKTRMAQTFEIADGKIYRIKLVFDTNAFN